jgi:hypothetical protein
LNTKGGFFAIGKPQWIAVCKEGLNPAVALLVLARGSGPDNRTTTWSCEAIYRHTGMSWRRAREAIEALERAAVVSTEKAGARPIRNIALPDQDDYLIWLPNELVDGAGDEIPPVTKLRQASDPDALQLLIELYGEQELAGDGGLPRTILKGNYERERICGYGPFDVYGFRKKDATAWKQGPLARYWGKAGVKGDVWECLNILRGMGLFEYVPSLAESDDGNAELLHALAGDEHAENVAAAAESLASELPGGFKYEAEHYDYVLPVPSYMKRATVVGVYRLRYRPKTSRTAAWYAQHVESCAKFADQYSRLASGEFRAAA